MLSTAASSMTLWSRNFLSFRCQNYIQWCYEIIKSDGCGYNHYRFYWCFFNYYGRRNNWWSLKWVNFNLKVHTYNSVHSGTKNEKKVPFCPMGQIMYFWKKIQMKLLKRGLIDFKKILIMFITVFTVGNMPRS